MCSTLAVGFDLLKSLNMVLCMCSDDFPRSGLPGLEEQRLLRLLWK